MYIKSNTVITIIVLLTIHLISCFDLMKTNKLYRYLFHNTSNLYNQVQLIKDLDIVSFFHQSFHLCKDHHLISLSVSVFMCI